MHFLIQSPTLQSEPEDKLELFFNLYLYHHVPVNKVMYVYLYWIQSSSAPSIYNVHVGQIIMQSKQTYILVPIQSGI